MSITNKIKLLALGLQMDQSVREVCPKCGGGKSREKSLSITRTPNGLFYNCYRAKCGGFRGFIESYDQTSGCSDRPRQVERGMEKHVSEDVGYGPLKAQDVGFFARSFGLTERECYMLSMGRVKDGEFLFTIYNSRGERVGHVNRSYNKRSPKAISRWYGNSEQTAARLHYHASAQGGKKHRIVIVEDQVSAVKVGRYAPAVALLGSWLTDEAVIELMGITENLVVALDQDAMRQAVKLRQKYLLSFRTFELVYLSKDPKNMNEEELKEWLFV